MHMIQVYQMKTTQLGASNCMLPDIIITHYAQPWFYDYKFIRFDHIHG